MLVTCPAFGILVCQLVDTHARAYDLLIADVLHDHALDLDLRALEGFECTVHHPIFQGDL